MTNDRKAWTLREVAEQAEVLYEEQRRDAEANGDVQGENFWASHRDTVRHALEFGSGIVFAPQRADGVGAPSCNPLADRALTSASSRDPYRAGHDHYRRQMAKKFPNEPHSTWDELSEDERAAWRGGFEEYAGEEVE